MSISAELVASGLNQPLFVTAPTNDTSRLFVMQRTGQVRILNLGDNSINATPFLNLGPEVSTTGERGLLGMAFHPNYQSNGLFYVHFNNSAGDTIVRQYAVSANPNVADPLSGQQVISIAQPQANHNGGWIGFGPNDGFLYVAVGDGGGGNDTGTGHTEPGGNAQDTTNNLLGKMLRLDVNGDDFSGDPSRNYAVPSTNPFVGVTGDDEIWAYGLRNPFRASFDRDNGDLYIGDVGQNTREEVDYQPATSSGGENYGWRLREGSIATPTGGVGGAPPPGNVDPIYDYAHGTGPLQGNTVTGGYVYRGPVLGLDGEYFFADFINNRIWSFTAGSGPVSPADITDWTSILSPGGEIQNIASFGEDALGNLYLLDLFDGEIFRITGPVAQNLVIPEPSSLVLSIMLGAVACYGRRRRTGISECMRAAR